MSDKLQEARDRRRKLLEEIDLIDQFIGLHERLFGDASKAPIENVSSTQTQEPITPRIRRRNNPSQIADRAEAVIRAVGHPVQRGELVKRIESDGLPIHSDDKAKYIGTVLWRESDRFENIEGEGYWLKGIPRTGEMRQGSVFE